MLIQDILEPWGTLVLPAKGSSASFNKFHVLLNQKFASTYTSKTNVF